MAYTTINKPNQYFNTVTYTGNGVNPTSITSVGFKPDWLWIKCRSNAVSNLLFDSVRGPSKRLISNSTAAESTETQIASFDTNGWTMDADTANNGSGRTYVAWNWLASNTTTSNTSGTISSTVSVNQTAGFSIISYTGNGSADATVGHGLGITPAFFVVKNRQDGTTNWNCYHQSLGKNLVMQLSTTSGQISVSNYWGTTGPTSTTIQLLNDGNINAGGQTLICYAFAQKQGYSKFGSFSGNGNADGTFVYTGFKPAFIITKLSSDTGSWFLHDNKRNGYNGGNNYVYPNASDAELTTQLLDITSNGFKMRFAGGANSSGTSIYMAFAENPFVSSTLIPTTAR